MHRRVQVEIGAEDAPKIDSPEEKHTTSESIAGFQGTALFIILQSIVCLIVFAAIFILKAFGGTAYENFSNWYNTKINESLVAGRSLEEYKTAFSEKIAPVSLISPTAKKHDAISTNICAPLAQGTITSRFGERKNPFTGQTQSHCGLDIAADKNSEIRAIFAGTVLDVAENASYGKYIILGHKNDVKSLYAHCSAVNKKRGDTVSSGEVIALVGDTGECTGAHLHLEVQVGEEMCDPENFLKGVYA